MDGPRKGGVGASDLLLPPLPGLGDRRAHHTGQLKRATRFFLGANPRNGFLLLDQPGPSLITSTSRSSRHRCQPERNEHPAQRKSKRLQSKGCEERSKHRRELSDPTHLCLPGGGRREKYHAEPSTLRRRGWRERRPSSPCERDQLARYAYPSFHRPFSSHAEAVGSSLARG